MKNRTFLQLKQILLKLLLSALVATFLSCNIHAQNKLNDVYAGVGFEHTINGTKSFHSSYYFRNDGTFCTNLNESNWSSRIDGNYQIKNNIIYVKFSSFDGSNELQIISKDQIRENATLLYKYNIVNEIPAQTYKQETDYGQIEELTFDGKGNFATAGFRNSSARDEKTEFDGSGRYTIKNSQLTLLYSDGRKVEKSFFSADGKSSTVLINGSTYNVISNGKTAIGSKSATPKTIEKNTKPSGLGDKSSTSTTGMDILKKANLANGGAALDQLKTLKLETTVNNVQVTQFIELTKKRVRVEQRKANQLISVEQLENSVGWQWNGAKTKPLSEARIKELQQTFTSSVLILRNSELKNIRVNNYEIDEASGAKTVSVSTGNNENVLILDKDNKLIAQIVTVNGTQTGTSFQDFAKISGIILPSTYKVQNSSGLEYSIKFSAMLVNPIFSESEWAKP